MVFGLVTGAVTSCAAFVFPTFASYKAIKANDVTQLTPWLMFWSVLACFLFMEYWTYFILQWVPLYREVKMMVVLWMVLPQTQGATYLYLHYLHPNLLRHERDIDRLIIRLHEQAKSRGGQYLHLCVMYIQDLLFGPTQGTMQSTTKSEPTSNSEGYVASLFSRFRTVPVGAYPETIPSTLLSFLSMSGKQGGDIIPAHLTPEERTKYVAMQKSKLNEWLQMLDAAAASYPPINVGRRSASRSASGAHTPDSEYEDIGADESLKRPVPASNGSWFWRARTTP